MDQGWHEGAGGEDGFLRSALVSTKEKKIIERLGLLSQPLNYFWIVEQDAVVEWALLR